MALGLKFNGFQDCYGGPPDCIKDYNDADNREPYAHMGSNHLHSLKTNFRQNNLKLKKKMKAVESFKNVQIFQ